MSFWYSTATDYLDIIEIATILIFIALLILFILIDKLVKSMGKIQINLEKISFLEGEIIKGKVILKLRKPIFADKLEITLECVDFDDKKICLETYTIANDLELKSGEYSFKIRIPNAIIESVRHKGYYYKKWFINARLKSPKLLCPLSSFVEINIQEAPRNTSL
ncbi:MAG: hypothetical protein N3F05_01550 [Candidatus Diapherotrites archaeon]|nr:hypothetical protein [Candidatus Diapherotrites archaeon]